MNISGSQWAMPFALLAVLFLTVSCCESPSASPGPAKKNKIVKPRFKTDINTVKTNLRSILNCKRIEFGIISDTMASGRIHSGLEVKFIEGPYSHTYFKDVMIDIYDLVQEQLKNPDDFYCYRISFYDDETLRNKIIVTFGQSVIRENPSVRVI